MTGTEELVSRQIADYSLRQRLQKSQRQSGKDTGPHLSYGPYLLISRERGSGGDTVAHLVGDRLGWRVFDREIVDEIAQRTQVRHQLIESLDERDRSIIEKLLVPALNRSDIGEAGYLHQLKIALMVLGQQGNVIIVGRGARYLLPRQYGLSVRLIAPVETRISRIAEEHQITLDAARTIVLTSDRERAAFIRHSFHRELNDPLAHDLIVNTDQLTPAAIADSILTLITHKLGITAAAG